MQALFFWMSAPTAEVWLGILADLSLKSSVILAFAGVITLVRRRASAAEKHLVWTLAVVGLLALPFLSTLLPSWRVPWLPPWSAPSPGPAERSSRIPIEPASVLVPKYDLKPDQASTTKSWVVAKSLISTSTVGPWPWTAWLLLAWIVGGLLVVAPLVTGHLAASRLTRRADLVNDGDWAQTLKESSETLGTSSRTRLLASQEIKVPMAWGWRRPVVILPVAAADWPPVRRRLVLLHELAHIKRRDGVTQFLAGLACALYWLNPLVWLAVRRLRIECERACDDLVLSSGSKASDYADQLLQVSAHLAVNGPVSDATLAMARRSTLEGRLLSILDQARNRQVVSPRAVWAGIVILVGVATPMSMLHGGDNPAGNIKVPPQQVRGVSNTQEPLPEQSPMAIEATNVFTVTISKQAPFLHVGAQPVTAEELRNRLAAAVQRNAETILYIRADQQAPFKQIVDVVDLAKAVNMVRFSLHSEPVGDSAAARSLVRLVYKDGSISAEMLSDPDDTTGQSQLRVLKRPEDQNVMKPSTPEQLRLQQAQQELSQVQELYYQKMASQAEYEKAKMAVAIAAAELKAPTIVKRLTLQQAEKELKQAEELHRQNLISQAEYEKAKLAVAIAVGEIEGDFYEIERIRLQEAEHELKRTEELYRQKLVSEAEYSQAKFNVERASISIRIAALSTEAKLATALGAAELKGDVTEVRRLRLQQAEQELKRAEVLYPRKVISQAEYEKAKIAVAVAAAELKGDVVAVKRLRLEQAEQDLKRAHELYQQKLISEAEFDKAVFAQTFAKAQWNYIESQSNSSSSSSPPAKD